MLRLLRKESPRGSDVAHFDVSHAGETYRVKLKRSAAARRFILRFRAATQDVVLTIPARAKLIDAKAFAERQAPGSAPGCVGCRISSNSGPVNWCRCAAFRTGSNIDPRSGELSGSNPWRNPLGTAPSL